MKNKISALMFVLGVLLGGTAVFFFVRTQQPTDGRMVSEPVPGHNATIDSDPDADPGVGAHLEEADSIPDPNSPTPNANTNVNSEESEMDSIPDEQGKAAGTNE